jgi:hypothetical protein
VLRVKGEGGLSAGSTGSGTPKESPTCGLTDNPTLAHGLTGHDGRHGVLGLEHGVEDDHEFTHDGEQRDLARFAGAARRARNFWPSSGLPRMALSAARYNGRRRAARPPAMDS